ncbi:hypothetical protein [Prolixibacter sp. SD074]|uniref:hypothetical protein n=1 Tax=Prolixibacter sp. SD074 TaxID=2652391 RepID=UPI001298FCC6|nr:hypothetical protein [Prolixibacter sp. SD074]
MTKRQRQLAFIKLFIFSYVKHHKQLSREGKSKTGQSFYLWIHSINVALLSFILFLILH